MHIKIGLRLSLVRNKISEGNKTVIIAAIIFFFIINATDSHARKKHAHAYSRNVRTSLHNEDLHSISAMINLMGIYQLIYLISPYKDSRFNLRVNHKVITLNHH